MSKKLILFFVSLVFFASFRLAFASLSINEIMYALDGTDIDWVEVYNPDSSAVDLTTMKLLISNSTSNHGIVKYSGSQTLNAGEYGIIVPTSQISNFTGKWGNSGNLFTSSFTLPNDTGKVEINNGDKDAPVSSVTYDSSQGASEDGNSLQKISGSWVASAPTPGALNQTSSGSGSGGNTTSTPSGPSGGPLVTNYTPPANTTSTKSKTPEEVKISTKIIAKNFAFSGVPIQLGAEAFGHDKEPVRSGKYFWNFGDGDSKEIKGSNLNEVEQTSHTYFYPGAYNITLEYYENYYSDTPDATDKLNITVVEPDISISKVGDEKDFFVELTNNTAYDADVSSWVLSGTTKGFTLPKNTLIESKKKITLSSQVTHLTLVDKDNLKLITPQNQIAFDYNAVASSQPIQSVSEKMVVSVAENKSTSQKSTVGKEVKETEIETSSPNIIEASSLEATPIASDTIKENQNGSYFVMLGAGILIAVSAVSVYFIRRKKVIAPIGEDFNILEE